MFKLLPQQEKKRLHKEYLARLFIVALTFIFCAQVIGIISLVPAFLLSKAKVDQITAEQRALGQTLEKERDVDLDEDIKKAKAQVDQLQLSTTTMATGKLFESIINDRTAGIKIVSFNLDRRDGSQSSLVLNGTAITRDTLVLFQKTLEKEAMFSLVDLPVSDLAKSRDLTFSLRITGTF